MKIQYKTKNKQLLIDYLQKTAGKHVTVQEICDHFKSRGENIGTTTVYRQLERLVDEGCVKKYFVDGSSAAYFEYVDHADCGHDACFHCKCSKCGKLIHLHCHEMEAIQSHIFAHHGFKLDNLKTVFYGVCESCG